VGVAAKGKEHGAEDPLAALGELVASDVAARLGATSGLLSAQELADALGVSRKFVYTHAGRLGAMEIGDGPRPRLRFDLARARAALRDVAEATPAPTVRATPSRRPQARKSAAGSILKARP